MTDNSEQSDNIPPTDNGASNSNNPSQEEKSMPEARGNDPTNSPEDAPVASDASKATDGDTSSILVPPKKQLATIDALPAETRQMISTNTSKGWWWDQTLNSHRGCDRVSAGCANCWCLNLIGERLSKNPTAAYANGPRPTYHPEVLDQLRRDLQPKRYFTPSTSDPLHEQFSYSLFISFIERLGQVPWHYFIVLTKRADRLAEIGPYVAWPENVLMVVSVEDERYLHRIDILRACGASNIGVSFEPLIGRVPLDTEDARRRYIRDLDFTIVGGETAEETKCRPMEVEWARELYRACIAEGVPFFFKQWGDIDVQGNYVGKKKAGRLLDGRTHDDLPRGCVEHFLRAQFLVQVEKKRRAAARVSNKAA